jgi:hypothetical protein
LFAQYACEVFYHVRLSSFFAAFRGYGHGLLALLRFALCDVDA